MLAVTFADSAFARWLRISLAALILVTGIAVSGILPVHRAAASSAVTTSDLNLRAGPSTGNHVKLVMPPNASVSLLSELGRSGFYKVSYGGETGYAYADYLAIGGSDSNFIDAGWSNAGSSSTTSALNLRQGPGTGYDIRLVMPYGAKLTLTGAADSGFVGVIYNGTNGWASEQYLAQTGQWSDSGANGSETVYTISSLNLRSGPSMSNTVLVVMPAAAEVTLNGDEQDGWVSVTYDGTEGWAASSYLSENKPKSGGTTSTSSGGNVVDIIYAAAARYGQNGDALLAVASCESGLNPNAVNSSSGASGLFQFLPGTWATTPYANQSIFDPVANAEAAAWMWSVGRRGEWYC